MLQPLVSKSIEIISLTCQTNKFSTVRAHQKDSYFESVLRSKIHEVIQIYKGQRFVNTFPDELGIAAKLIYLCLTTLRGAKTLGEEYTDLIYVSKGGKRLPKTYQRLGFILSYLIVPYAVSKFFKKIVKEDESHDEKDDRPGTWFSNLSYKDVSNLLLNVHLAVFYLHGKYYQFSKRIFGLRYVFGHSVNKEQSNGSYEALGALIFIQLLFKVVNKINELALPDEDSETEQELLKSENFGGVLYGLPSYKSEKEIDLLDPRALPFIPEVSRKCMLCLEYMKVPSLAPCGHFFCWKCISDWNRERSECPLCRQLFHLQQVIPIR